MLTQLAQTTGETALLTVPGDPPVSGLCLERVETSQPLRLSIEPGRSVPLHAGASQKAILANIPEELRERVLRTPLERLSRGTITNRDALRRELTQIREQGWAISLEENDAHAWGVAVPIIDGSGDVVGSIGLAAPDVRLSPELALDHIKRCATAAESLSAGLGALGVPIQVDRNSAAAKGLTDRIVRYLADRAHR
jgi:DNA-binding IclR family transcriptional regulator